MYSAPYATIVANDPTDLTTPIAEVVEIIAATPVFKSWNKNKEWNACWWMLPADVVEFIFDALDDGGDWPTAAALCLATPIQGAAAIKARKDWKLNPAFSIAVRLHTVGRRVLDEALLRKYAHDKRAGIEHLDWMNRNSLRFEIQLERYNADENDVLHRHEREIENFHVGKEVMAWMLVDTHDEEDEDEEEEEDEPTNGARLRLTSLWDNENRYFDGHGHTKAMIRWESTNGQIYYFSSELAEGEEQCRLTCIRQPNGKSFTYYDGPNRNERKTKHMNADGTIIYYTGAPKQERKLYKRFLDGSTEHYSGAKGAERKIRLELGNETIYFVGNRGEERMTSKLLPNDREVTYNGPPGEEYKVSVTYVSGKTIYYEGAKGQEKKVKVVKANGEVVLF